VCAGLVLGLAAAGAFSTALSAYLFATPPRDPVVLLAVAAIFVLAGLLACLGPARRATSVDPLVALKAESGARPGCESMRSDSAPPRT
jgi:ABC-type antimicrobial peptide transport system permease subunit